MVVACRDGAAGNTRRMWVHLYVDHSFVLVAYVTILFLYVTILFVVYDHSYLGRIFLLQLGLGSGCILGCRVRMYGLEYMLGFRHDVCHHSFALQLYFMAVCPHSSLSPNFILHRQTTHAHY